VWRSELTYQLHTCVQMDVKVSDPNTKMYVEKAELVRKYKCLSTNASQIVTITWDDRADPMCSYDMAVYMASGGIKSELCKLFKKSSEKFVNLQRVDTKLDVVAAKAFAIDAMMLCPLTNNISIYKAGSLSVKLPCASSSIFSIGRIFDCDGAPCVGFLRSCWHMPGMKQVTSSDHARPSVGESFMPLFWAVEETNNPDMVNCEIKLKTVKVTWSDRHCEIEIPLLQNVKHIEKGDHLVRLRIAPIAHPKRLSDGGSKDEPPAKKAKPTPKHATKGKHVKAKA
jgi:hypothetical protein